MPKPVKKKFNYTNHKAYWSNCDQCRLCETRRKVVLVRGKLPADVLFVGEAPGVSEDMFGKPFQGPAGHLLDQLIEDGMQGRATYAMTNLVGCIPKTEDNQMAREPPKESLEACSGRVEEVVRLCRPAAIVCVGKLAEEWMPKIASTEDHEYFKITHPAALMRADISQKGLAIQKCLVTLSEVADFIDPV